MNEEPEIAVKYTYDQLQDKWKREKVQVLPLQLPPSTSFKRVRVLGRLPSHIVP